MATLHKCEACKGAKQILALGNIIKDCDICEGIGYVSQENDDETEITQPMEKKRARKQWLETKASESNSTA